MQTIVGRIENGKVSEIYDSVLTASQHTGADDSHIYKVCKGVRQTAGGYQWTKIAGKSASKITEKLGSSFGILRAKKFARMRLGL